MNSKQLEFLLSRNPDVAPFHIPIRLAKLSPLRQFKNLVAYTWEDEYREEVVNSDILDHKLSFPSVTDLTVAWSYPLQGVLLLRFIACFPNILSFSVDEHTLHRLMKYVLDVGPQMEELQNTTLSLPCLRHLSFEGGALALVVPQLLYAAGSSLRRIKIKFRAEFGALTIDLLNLSAATHLTHLEVYLRFNPTTDRDWGDVLAAPLSHLDTSQQSLAHIIFDILTYMGEYEDEPWHTSNERLAQELFRVMDEVPKVIVTFRQQRNVSSYVKDSARGSLCYGLRSLTLFHERLRFAWDGDGYNSYNEAL